MTERDLDSIPPIVPARDEVASRQGARKGRPERRKTPPPSGGGGMGLFARLLLVVTLVVAAVACAWAWQLQQELQKAQTIQRDYEARISDLEDRLSDTDEGMNQSAAAMSVKIKELYSEVDKLWASAWRRNKAKLEELEKSVKSQGGSIATLNKTDKEYSSQLKSLGVDIDKLRQVAGDLERLLANSNANQQALESLGDDVSRMTLDYARLSKRVTTNEEWVESVNGFRKQINRTTSELQTRVNALQAGAAAPGP